MSPDQITAFRTFLLAALRAPASVGGDPVTFDASSVVRAYGDFPRAASRWCAFRLLTDTGLSADGDTWRENMRQQYRIDVDGDTATAGVALAPANSDFDPASVSVGTFGGDPEAKRDALLAALQALEGPTHPAVYVADDADPATPAIEATATEAARGVWLNLTTSGADLSTNLLRDNLAYHSREPVESVISVQCYSRMREIDTDPDDLNLHAQNLLAKVRTRCMSPIATSDLRAAGVAPRRFQPVRDISGLLRGSQWETRAVLDMTVSIMRATVDQPGTIENTEISGTPSPGPTVTIDTRS